MKSRICAASSRGCPVYGRMIGDIFVVVVDEIGEVTFARSPMWPQTVELSKKETTGRCFDAVVELLDLCSTLVPVSKTQFLIMQAMESLLTERGFLLERFIEQVLFNDSLDEAASGDRLLEGNSYRKRRK
jgi:hypothetical protein